MLPQGLTPNLGHYLAGFTDGEGCFDLKVVNKEWIIARFTIGLREDDAAILDEFHSATGVGTRFLRKGTGRQRLGRQEVWEVSRKADCRKLVEIFDAYPLRAKKLHDYEIWREAVLIWNACRKGSRQHGRSPHTAEMFRLRDELLTFRRGWGEGRDAITSGAKDRRVAPRTQLSISGA